MNQPNPRRVKRSPCPWTCKDQLIAEVAAACGVPVVHIGKLLGRTHSVVRCHLIIDAAEKQKKAIDLWRQNEENVQREIETRRARYLRNREIILSKRKAYRLANLEKERERVRRWQIANPEKTRAASRRWREANREKCNAASCRWRFRNPGYYRSYYLANQKEVLRKNRIWHAENKELTLEHGRQWRKRNKEKVARKAREWRNRNLEKAREYVRKRLTRVRSANHRSIQPLTLEQKKARFAIWRHCCAYCGASESVALLTVDHVTPLVMGGLDEAGNILPACKPCNSSKNAKPVEAWYRRQPFFDEDRWRKICRHAPSAVAGQLLLSIPPPVRDAGRVA